VTRWLLNTLPTWGLLLLVPGVLIALAAGGQLVVRRRWPHVAGGEHNDVAGVMLGVLGGVYGIVLAFVIVALYEDFQAAKETVHEEATHLAQLQRNSGAFPPAVQVRIAAEIGGYAEAVVGEEWRLMEDGRESARAWARVDELYKVLQGYEPRTESESAFYGEAVAKLDEVVGSRRARLAHAQESLPGTFQIMIVGGALLLLGFLYFFGMQSTRAQLVMVVGVAGLIGFNLVLAVVLDHPFSGDMTVSHAPFREGALARFFP
jgi:hypothetical protein